MVDLFMEDVDHLLWSDILPDCVETLIQFAQLVPCVSFSGHGRHMSLLFSVFPFKQQIHPSQLVGEHLARGAVVHVGLQCVPILIGDVPKFADEFVPCLMIAFMSSVPDSYDGMMLLPVWCCMVMSLCLGRRQWAFPYRGLLKWRSIISDPPVQCRLRARVGVPLWSLKYMCLIGEVKLILRVP